MKKQTWWSRKWGSDKICSITHTRIRPGKNSMKIPHTIQLNCKHSFYRKALIKWVENSPNEKATCPMCRAHINNNLLINE